MSKLVEIQGLCKSYGSSGSEGSVKILRGLDLAVDAGEAMAVVGRSGSGKSTLLNLIGALDQPDEGKILVDGEDISLFDDKQVAEFRNQTVGFVFQMHHLLPQCTILENVLVPTLAGFSKPGAEGADRRAWELLERVGLKNRAHHRPGQLSGGERQRASVARALINQPKLLLADEPTGSLDQATAEQLFDLLLELNRNEDIAMIVVTHAVDLARRAGRVLGLESGTLVPK